MKGLSLQELITQRVSTADVVSHYLERIRRYNPTLNACTDVVETYDATGEGKLAGMPIAFKANIATTTLQTHASSDVLRGYVSPFNATLVHNLLSNGAGVLAKTNMDAWAHGSSTETSDFGPSRNPYNTDHVPGGSSGGSAVAVAAGLAPAAIGSETGGSIRLPAAWTGIVGLKPTYGRVSRYGIVAMGSSWDCPGPMTQTVEDAALLLECMAGHDAHDATTSTAEVRPYTSAIHETTTYTIGVPEVYFEGVDDEISASVRHAIEMLKDQGHTLVPVSLLSPELAISVYMLLQRSEVSSNLNRYDGIRYGQDRTHFHEEAKKRIMLGTHALSAGYVDEYYKKAQKVRYLIREDFQNIFQHVDALIAPTTPIVASRIGDSKNFAYYGEKMDILTEPAAAAGIPAISIPSGMHSTGLPMGLQLMGRHDEESTLLSIAHRLEKTLHFDRLKILETYA